MLPGDRRVRAGPRRQPRPRGVRAVREDGAAHGPPSRFVPCVTRGEPQDRPATSPTSRSSSAGSWHSHRSMKRWPWPCGSHTPISWNGSRPAPSLPSLPPRCGPARPASWKSPSWWCPTPTGWSCHPRPCSTRSLPCDPDPPSSWTRSTPCSALVPPTGPRVSGLSSTVATGKAHPSHGSSWWARAASSSCSMSTAPRPWPASAIYPRPWRDRSHPHPDASTRGG